MIQIIECEWVVGVYTGLQAKQIEALAAAGTGYLILAAAGQGGTLGITVAFRKAIDSPLPEHLQRVTDPLKIQKYERWRMQ